MERLKRMSVFAKVVELGSFAPQRPAGFNERFLDQSRPSLGLGR